MPSAKYYRNLSIEAAERGKSAYDGQAAAVYLRVAEVYALIAEEIERKDAAPPPPAPAT